jgi:hypothetical protein
VNQFNFRATLEINNMKLRATMLLFAALCFLVTSPAWAAPSICNGVPGNFITNCGFEDGNFTGWTQGGNTGFTGVTGSVPYVNSGTFGAQLGPVGSDGTLSQSFAGNTLMFSFRQDPAYWGLDDVVALDVGTCGNGCNLWDISFYLYNDGGTPNDFTVFWNGVDIGPSLVDDGALPYTLFEGVVQGSSTPEPSSLILLGSGLLGLAGVIRRKLSV